MWYKIITGALAVLLGISACQNKGTGTGLPQKRGNGPIKYAKRFQLLADGAATVVYLFGNRRTNDTTAVFVVCEDTAMLQSQYTRAKVIKSPCKKIAALSSIYANLFYELGDLDKLCAIDNIDYIVNPAILECFETKHLRELAKAPHIDLEQTVSLNPDIIFTFGMGEGEKDIDKKLAQTGIPTVISIDHLEESPLARAEWMKLFAVFTGKRALADSIFEQVEKNYLRLRAMASTIQQKPSVFSEIKYSEFWYMPGGKSYMACLLKDAGTRYLWADNDDFGSLPLSFEQVYARAHEGDFWINLSTLKTKKELLAFESRYKEFKAFQSGNLYNNNRFTNQKGYSNYWETGMIHPDRILSDFIQVFHPQLKDSVKNDLYYYERLR